MTFIVPSSPAGKREWRRYLIRKIAEVYGLTLEDLREMGIREEYMPVLCDHIWEEVREAGPLHYEFCRKCGEKKYCPVCEEARDGR